MVVELPIEVEKVRYVYVLRLRVPARKALIEHPESVFDRLYDALHVASYPSAHHLMLSA